MSESQVVLVQVMDFEDEKKHVFKFRGHPTDPVTAFYVSKKSFPTAPKRIRITVEVLE